MDDAHTLDRPYAFSRVGQPARYHSRRVARLDHLPDPLVERRVVKPQRVRFAQANL